LTDRLPAADLPNMVAALRAEGAEMLTFTSNGVEILRADPRDTIPAMEQPTGRTSNVAMVVAGFVVGALVIGIIHLARPTSTPASAPSASTAAQPPSTFSAADTAAAKAKLCTTFQHADAAIGGTINAPDGAEPGAAKVNARAAVVSSALALTRAVGPVTPPDIAKPANDLADAYSAYALTAFAQGKSDPSAVVNATAALRQACG
jgi:hypothetical protein